MATDIVGIVIWVVGFFLEAIADYQLSSHLKDPASDSGKYLKTGLWAFSRHPNYFGEMLMWWGIYAMSTSCLYGWRTVYSALILSIFIRFLTGVPVLEKKHGEDEEWMVYKEETNVFFPWKPSKKPLADQKA